MKNIATKFRNLIFTLMLLSACHFSIHLLAGNSSFEMNPNGKVKEMADTLKSTVVIPAEQPRITQESKTGQITSPSKKLKSPVLTPSQSLLANFTNFQTEDGLALSSIGCGFMDKSGNLWFGTLGGGVSRYDGKSFTTFTTEHGLAYNWVSSIIEDKNDNLWFGTFGGGVSFYDGETFTTFTTGQGLANNRVYSIIEDNGGNLWFGTDGGVSRYDMKLAGLPCQSKTCKHDLQVGSDIEDHNSELKKSFITFTTQQGLADNRILSIAADKTGNLWFGTDGAGVSRYSGSITDLPCQSNTCKHNLMVRQDLVLHNSELAKSFKNFTIEDGLANNRISSLTIDKSGHLWFGTLGGGVSRYDGKTFRTYTTGQGLAYDRVISITADKKGDLWFGTSGGGVSLYNMKYEDHPCQSNACKHDLLLKQDLKSHNNQLAKSFRTFSTARGLANNRISSITEDKNGDIWFGTFGGGLSRYEGKSFETFASDQGLANSRVSSIVEDRSGCLWFGTLGGGVSRYDGRSFENFGIEQGLVGQFIRSIAEDKSGNLWFGTGAFGVSRYDGKSFTTMQSLGSQGINAIMEDSNGNLWFGTNGGGVGRYNGDLASLSCQFNTCKHHLRMEKDLEKHNEEIAKFFTTFTTEQGLANNIVYNIIEDKTGALWFGTDGGGVSRFDGKAFENFTTRHGLIDNIIYSITEDKSGNLWFGSLGGGVSVLELPVLRNIANKNNSKRNTDDIFINITKAEGLADLVVHDMVETPEGNMVFGTNLGYSILFDGIKGLKSGIMEWGYFNNKTGYPIKELKAMCITKVGFPKGEPSEDIGIIWGGFGDNKIIRFDPRIEQKNTEPPRVIIQSVKINEEDICWYNLDKNQIDSTTIAQQEMMTYGKLLSGAERDSIRMRYSKIKFDGITKFYPVPENLILPYEHNSVSFDFVGVETGRSFLTRYRYILEGYDKAWSPITNKTSATFGNINEGIYTFKLKARSPEGVWSEPVTYTFKVRPSWWKAWWMYVVYGFSGIGFMVLIVRWNGIVLRTKARDLQNEVRKATREIQEKNKKLENANIEISKQKKVVEKKHKEITDSIQYAKRIQDSILPSHETLNINLKDAFLLYMPKDVVAGDFFWMEQYQDKIYFAAADCTGHGVPGALVGIVCSNALSKTLLEENITETGKLLEGTRELVIHRFAKSGEGVKEGMDISLCALDLKTLQLQWSGANNPLWILRKGEMMKYKPDRMPIGKYFKTNPFTTHDIQLEKDDIIYIFSDGYRDQFGGPNGKKFLAKRLNELLLTISDKSMDNQKKILHKAFEEWKGDLEQVDDVCIIGVKV